MLEVLVHESGHEARRNMCSLNPHSLAISHAKPLEHEDRLARTEFQRLRDLALGFTYILLQYARTGLQAMALHLLAEARQIGRASCRERVCHEGPTPLLPADVPQIR